MRWAPCSKMFCFLESNWLDGRIDYPEKVFIIWSRIIEILFLAYLVIMTSLASRDVNSGRSSRQQHTVSLHCYRKEEHQFHSLPFLLPHSAHLHLEGERRGQRRRQMDPLWLPSNNFIPGPILYSFIQRIPWVIFASFLPLMLYRYWANCYSAQALLLCFFSFHWKWTRNLFLGFKRVKPQLKACTLSNHFIHIK